MAEELVDLDAVRGRKKQVQLMLEEGRLAVQAEKTRVEQLEAELRQVVEKESKLSLEPRVTDHAICQFLERKLGVKLDDVRKEILPDEVLPTVRAIVNGEFTLPCGLRGVFQNMVLVTVKPPGKNPNKKGRRR